MSYLSSCLHHLVELPGIEPAAKIGVTCGNADSDDAKQRENDAKRPADTPSGVDGVNRPQVSWRR
jgi:hypothetical protein